MPDGTSIKIRTTEKIDHGIGVDLSTGFVFGGNPHKGSSEKAGTKGDRAGYTPRWISHRTGGLGQKKSGTWILDFTWICK